MVGAVVFDDELGRRKVEVSSPNEATIGVAEIYLNLWVRQSGLNQEPPEPGLHG
jgi:hypothetical protein